MFGKHSTDDPPADLPGLPCPYPDDAPVIQDLAYLDLGDAHGAQLLAAEHVRDGKLAGSMPHAPAVTPEAVKWYAGQHESGSTAWFQLCLAAARIARGIPAMFPRARTAGEATPAEFRVSDPADVLPGMVLFFWGDGDDLNGHVATATFNPRERPGLDAPTWTNDALTRGGIDKVPGAWFPLHWRKPFRFAATCLNGYELDGAWNKLPAPQPAHGRPVDLLRDLREAHMSVVDAARQAEDDGRDTLAQLLDADAELIARRLTRLSGGH